MRTPSIHNTLTTVSDIEKGVKIMRDIAPNSLVESQENCVSVFHNENDIQVMEFIKEKYNRNFENSKIVEKFPDEITSTVISKSHLLGLWKQKTWTVKQPLSLSKLLQHHEIRHGVSQITSPNKSLTDFLVAQGENYVIHREHHPVHRRQVRKAFGDIQDPRYYIVFILSLLAEKFCSEPINEELIAEYRYFHHFLSEIQESLPIYFPKTRGENGFHDYVAPNLETIQKLRENTIFWNERKTISDLLKEINKAFGNMMGDISVFSAMCYCPLAMEEKLCLIHFESESRHLPESFTKSPFYSLVHHALMDLDTSFQLELDIESIPTRIVNKIVAKNHHRDLLNLLNSMRRTLGIYDAMARAADYFGEQIFVENSELKIIFDANLKMLSIYLSTCEVVMGEIHKITTKATRGLSFTPGFAMNVVTANKKLNSFRELVFLLNTRINEINRRINTLLEMKEPDLQATTSHLVEQTIAVLKKPKTIEIISDKVKIIYDELQEKISKKPAHTEIASNEIIAQYPLTYCLIKDDENSLSEFNIHLLAIHKIYQEASEALEKIDELMFDTYKFSLQLQNQLAPQLNAIRAILDRKTAAKNNVETLTDQDRAMMEIDEVLSTMRAPLGERMIQLEEKLHFPKLELIQGIPTCKATSKPCLSNDASSLLYLCDTVKNESF